ncbi:hypothetical protein IMSHALPRED_001266 [Imshaugia aleurites]|uniref:Uncharacterized protein n=1 Tax=Imshaugia aleurites TaxID=172621 RepID=A0A8H3J270_9LECA|nr:hypothetical protein IMSHALPRED_001266 [Imshaugia aleurites]
MKIRSAFLSFIREFNRSQPKWYHEASHGFESYEDVVDDFITTILAIFPVVYIDDSLDNPDRLGGHLRREWDFNFQPYNQSINLNGSRVRDMVAADGQKCFRTFLFIFANTFLHEIAHIFVTYLDKGRSNTPPRIRAEVGGYSREDMGEAGRHLETTLFGGTLEYYRDHAMDDNQPGVPHILTKHGARRISQVSIDDTVSYQFHSPYRLEGPLVNNQTMQSLGVGYSPINGQHTLPGKHHVSDY